MNHWNLIPSRRLAVKRRQLAIHRWILIDGGYCCALAIVALVYGFSAFTESRAPSNNISSAEIERANAAVAKQRQEAAVLRAQTQSASEIANRPDWSVLLAVLSRTLGDDVFLSSVDCMPDPAMTTLLTSASPIETSPREFRISGIGRTQQAVAHFILSVEKLNLFERVQMVQTAPRAMGGQECIGFQISCAVRPAKGGD